MPESNNQGQRDRRQPAPEGESPKENTNRGKFRKQNNRKKHKKIRTQKPEAAELRQENKSEQQRPPRPPKKPKPEQDRQSQEQRSRQPVSDREKEKRKPERQPRPAPASTEPAEPALSLELGDEDNDFLLSKEKEEALIAAMPPDPTLDAVFGDPPLPEPEPEDGVEIVGVHFPQGAKVYYFDPAGRKIAKGTKVVVETSRGFEIGEVAFGNRLVPTASVTGPLKPVVRIATAEDLAHAAENLAREPETMKICEAKVAAHKLDMKLVGAQYTFDNSKLIVYFTAAQRVDFRELVRDLAQTFRTRIEMRQIGVRDEAKMVGGIGVCGRRLCCSVFLPNYAQVSIKMAKDQGLSLNSAKISGNCGRLLCCLRFEHGTYEEALAKLPTVDSTVDTPDGRGRVTDVKPMSGTVKVKLDSAPDAVPGVYSADAITVVRRAAEKPDSRDEREDGEKNGDSGEN